MHRVPEKECSEKIKNGKAWEEHGPDFFSNIQKSNIIAGCKNVKAGMMLCCIRPVLLIRKKMSRSLNI